MTIEQNYGLQEISPQDCTKVHGAMASEKLCLESPDFYFVVCTEPKHPVKPSSDHTNNHCIPAFSAAWRS